MTSEIESISGTHPQHGPIGDYPQTNMGIRSEFTAKGHTIERVVMLEQAKAMMETVRGQIG